ncbi:hypothetical protein [Laspinema olomoucense]|uniref:hypothetical protein n=1 Tax=Laspinema olomoucense TaxID=3231600 RepID=UPI0021BB361B|nr:hypothetical protein [Laspinema sp. D3c]MCT7996909.1 hypothetical protein [Laspinema sp. D3c]
MEGTDPGIERTAAIARRRNRIKSSNNPPHPVASAVVFEGKGNRLGLGEKAIA